MVAIFCKSPKLEFISVALVGCQRFSPLERWTLLTISIIVVLMMQNTENAEKGEKPLDDDEPDDWYVATAFLYN